MPTFQWNEGSKEEQEQRASLIEETLPKKPIVDSFLEPALMAAMKAPLLEALQREIEIYKKYPKKGKYDPKSFNPQNNTTCFMGQAFKANGHGFEGWEDHDLRVYRQRVGTIAHKEWGGCTLLEIWAGDHFKDYNKMVTGVFKYCWGGRKKMPIPEFHINPFYRNTKSGKFEATEIQMEQKDNAEHLTKIAAYCDIRDRLKKSGLKNPLELALKKEDDPIPQNKRRTYDDDDN